MEPTELRIQRMSGTISPEVQRQGREADCSPPSSAEVKNGEAIPPLPHVFIVFTRKLLGLQSAIVL
jgi:hypothetical protein